MKIADFIGGGLGIALGAYVIYEGAQMPEDHIMKIGPSFFPDLLATGLILFSSVLVIYALFGKAKGHAEPIRLGDKGVQRMLISLFAIVLYAALLKPVGYPICTTLLVGSIMFLLGKRQPAVLIGTSIITTLGVWLIFAKLLKLSMPMGVLSAWL